MADRLDWQGFWPFYLEEHAHGTNRALHVIGTTLVIGFLVAALVTQIWWFLLGTLLAGYAFAWLGHFFFEHNRPATFTYPFKSLVSDFRMWGLAITGRLGRTYDRLGIERK